MILGIDFGTSFSLASAVAEGKAEILLPSGKYGIPSVFYYDHETGVLVGEDAEASGQGTEAVNLKREIKLAMDSAFTADGRTFSAKEIVSHILCYVIETAIEEAQKRLIPSKLEGIVLTVPAAFEHNEREYVRQAAEEVTLSDGTHPKVLALIKEPVAAALAYFQASLAVKTKALVYDFGGGTCDVAVVESVADRERFVVLSSDMQRIGGRLWDQRFARYIGTEITAKTGKDVLASPSYYEKILRAAIKAKHDLSAKRAGNFPVSVTAPVEIDGRLQRVSVSRSVFDEITKEYLGRTIDMVKRQLEKAECKGVKTIVCVGGSSNMPQVREALQREFPTMELKLFEPEKAIAKGAAIYGEMIRSDRGEVKDIAAYSYGVRFLPNRVLPVYSLNNLVRKGEPLPASGETRFYTACDDQTLRFKVYETSQEERIVPFSKVDGEPILEVLCSMEGTKNGTPVSVTMTLNRDGILEFSASDGQGHTCQGKKKLSSKVYS
ncbi:MAG: Hsp70 family protein [Christensenellaceae bacterium]